ncbi:hypothetical protein, partial [Parabacteroides sp. PF5-9]|uniref:hypothetical protein n=1 Tax=Parabacteroides sp. PF5-9 TaxID=1742404 RepID=UPI0024771521
RPPRVDPLRSSPGVMHIERLWRLPSLSSHFLQFEDAFLIDSYDKNKLPAIISDNREFIFFMK